MGDVLSGQAAYVFWMSVIDAAILSWIAVRWYGRSMRALMNAPAARDAAAPQPDTASGAAVAPATDSPLLVAQFAPQRGRNTTASRSARLPGRGRLVTAYSAGAAVFAVIVTWVELAGESVSIMGWFARAWANAWPIVPALIVLLALNWREVLRLLAIYLGGGALLVVLLTAGLQLRRGALDAAPLTNVYWFLVGLAVIASIPAALVFVSGSRRLRPMMPLALAATLCFGLGLALFRDAIVRGFDVAAVRDFVLAWSVRTSTTTTYYGLFFLAALPIGWLAWSALRWIAGSYRRKAFSDSQLVVDCIWIIVAADHVTDVLTGSARVRGVLGVVLALAAYRAVVAVLLWRKPARPSERHRLLLLRVFGYQARTEVLFDRVAEQWRFLGPVQLIAGVDLATRSLDPGDVLAFVGGHLADQYVATPAELPDRVAALDVDQDPDGRFRVNELFCHADTWRPALLSLLEVTDTVLMDLRSFSPRSAGCRFELEQLARHIPADRIVLAYDGTTDLGLLARVLEEAWTGAGRDARAREAGRISVVWIGKRTGRELDALIDRLVGLGPPGKIVPVADLATASA
jgi:hypothetical protein